jgi:hypothetical protein
MCSVWRIYTTCNYIGTHFIKPRCVGRKSKHSPRRFTALFSENGHNKCINRLHSTPTPSDAAALIFHNYFTARAGLLERGNVFPAALSCSSSSLSQWKQATWLQLVWSLSFLLLCICKRARPCRFAYWHPSLTLFLSLSSLLAACLLSARLPVHVPSRDEVEEISLASWLNDVINYYCFLQEFTLCPMRSTW